jgi:hypothetical protein
VERGLIPPPHPGPEVPGLGHVLGLQVEGPVTGQAHPVLEVQEELAGAVEPLEGGLDELGGKAPLTTCQPHPPRIGSRMGWWKCPKATTSAPPSIWAYRPAWFAIE